MNLPTGYTIIERLHGSGDGAAVRANDAGGEDVFLKTPVDADRLWGEDQDTPKVEQRFEAAKVREQAAAAAQPEIFVSGRFERSGKSVFWVRPFLQGTLRDWVDFKVVPGPGRLSAVCLALIRGLATLVRLDGNGHGNLTLGNVLLHGKDNATVRLVDPVEADAAEVQSDKRALGLIIYQLVRSEYIELDANLTGVADDEDWQKLLGKSGDTWKAFCSDLLNPYSSLSQSDWGAIEARLKAIGSGQRSRGLFVVFALLLAGGVLYGVFMLVQSTEVPVTDLERERQWDQLLDDYFNWGYKLFKSRNASPVISEFAKSFDPDSERNLDPLQITEMLMNLSGMGARFYREKKESRAILAEVNILELSQAEQRKIGEAHRYLQDLRESIESWDVLTGLVQSRENFEANDFKFGVAQIDRLLERIDFSTSFSYADLLDLKETTAEVAGLQTAYREYEEAVSQLEALNGSEFVQAYLKHLREQVKGAEANPIKSLKRFTENAREVGKLWRDNVDALRSDLFRTAESDFLKTADLSDQSVVKDWGRIVKGYRQIDRAALEQRMKTLRSKTEENLRQWEKEIKALSEPDSEIPDFLGRLKNLAVAYNESIPADWIEKNRPRFDAALSAFKDGVQRLEKEARRRKKELSPNIEEGLAAMRGDSTNFQHPTLQQRWENFRESELDGKSEDSFTVGEFNRFRSRYHDQRDRLKHFEQQLLPQLRRAAPYERGDLPEALATAGETLWEELLEKAKDEMVTASVDLIFQEAKGDVSDRLERELKFSQEKFTAAVRELSDYLKAVQKGIVNFKNWEVPERGYRAFWEDLNASARHREWSANPSIADSLAGIRLASKVENMASDVLLREALDPNRKSFIRFLAFSRFSEIATAEVEQLQEIGEMLDDFDPKIPDAKRRNWNEMIKSVWIGAFEKADQPSDKALAMTVYERFGVGASDLSGAARFAFELKTAIDLLEKFPEPYEKNPSMLSEFVNNFKSLPEQGAKSYAAELIRDLEVIDLSADASTPTELPFQDYDWGVVDEETTEKRMTLKWADHRLTFHRVSGGTRDIFVSETELSIQLFSDWMRHVDWEPVKTEAVDDFPSAGNFDYRNGITLWNPPRSGLGDSGSLRQAEHWFSKFDQPIYTPLSELTNDEIPSDLFFEISFDLPMQHLGAKLAMATASSMGMRLPSPEEWERIIDVEVVAPSDVRVWSTRWEATIENLDGLDEFSPTAVAVLNEIRLDSFYAEISGQRQSSAEGPLLVSVGRGGQSRFKHLAGNVAEFLYDSDAGRYYVAGGSALAEVADTWKKPIEISRRDYTFPYSDVGLRLCFDAPVKSAARQFLNRMRVTWKSL